MKLTVTVDGKGGHTGYMKKADEVIYAAARLINALSELQFVDDSSPFTGADGTVAHVTNIASGTGAFNACDDRCQFTVDFRCSPAYTLTRLRKLVERQLLALAHEDASWRLSFEWQDVCALWSSNEGRLTRATDAACLDVLGRTPARSISGGSGDGRFLMGIVPEMCELGPPTAANMIHSADEFVLLSELDELARIYERILLELLGC